VLRTEDDFDRVGAAAVDRGLDCFAVVVERELVGYDGRIGKQSRAQDVECTVDGMAVGAAGEPGR